MTGEAGGTPPRSEHLRREARLAALRRGRSSDAWSRAVLRELEQAVADLDDAGERIRVQQEEIDLLSKAQLSTRWSHQRLVASLPAALVVTDEVGLIHQANPAAGALLGMRAHRLEQRPFLGFLTPSERTRVRTLLDALVRDGGDGFSIETEVQVRGGGAVAAQLAVTAAHDPVTGTTEVSWVVLDSEDTEDAEPAPPADPERAGDARSRCPRLAPALVELTQAPLATSSTSEILTKAADTCRAAFAEQVAVSVTLGDPAEPELVATSCKEAQRVDGAQIVAGEGPCHDAWRTADTVVTDDLTRDPRWPALPDRLPEATDLRAVVAVPLAVADEPAGALNVYAPDAWLCSPDAVRGAELLGRAVAAVVLETEVRRELEVLTEQLGSALRSRATIDQAKGILMARHGCTPDEAFRLLARRSSESNVKVRELAHRLVEEVGGLGAGPAHS